MLTPAELSNVVFDKVRLNGYNQQTVDDFIDTVTADFTKLFKENVSLKGKLKKLVETIEMYRSSENAMRETLFTAQKTGEKIVEEAERRHEEILRKTDEEVEAKLRETAELILAEQENLRLAREETARYLREAEILVARYSEALRKLDELRRESELAAEARSTAAAGSEPRETPEETELGAKQPARAVKIDDEDDEPQPRTRPDYSDLHVHFGSNPTQK